MFNGLTNPSRNVPHPQSHYYHRAYISSLISVILYKGFAFHHVHIVEGIHGQVFIIIFYESAQIPTF